MNESSPQRAKQAWFMPWIGIKKTLHIGKCEIWPFTSSEIASHISDKQLEEHLFKYFACYVDHHGNPVNSVAVCSYEGRNFTRLSASEAASIRFAIDMLSFSTISKGLRAFHSLNNHLIPPSSDRFQLLSQLFTPGIDDIAVGSGNCISGGFKLGAITFPVPWCLGGPCLTIDEQLLEALTIVFTSSFPQDERERFRKGLEWFRLSHTQSDDVTEESKIVMMATALEIVLNIPQSAENKQTAIADWLDEFCTYSDSIRKVWNGTPQKEHALIGYWARSFYDLRNSIVHGGAKRRLTYTTDENFELPHLDVASLVFWECIVRKLFHAGAFPDIHQLLERILSRDQSDFADQQSHLLFNFFDFGKVHRTLGWIPPLPTNENQQS